MYDVSITKIIPDSVAVVDPKVQREIVLQSDTNVFYTEVRNRYAVDVFPDLRILKGDKGDIGDKGDKGDRGATGTVWLTYNFPLTDDKQRQWHVQHNQSTRRFVFIARDDSGAPMMVHHEILDENSFVIDMEEAVGGSVDVCFEVR